MSPGVVARYQRAIARHRMDLLYYVHSSRVAANMLGEIRHRCFSERVVSRFAHRHLCGANLSWPYRVNLSVVSACSTLAESSTKHETWYQGNRLFQDTSHVPNRCTND
eukprot:scaffold136940_cov127-Phaeocystis_antarctica.AAC.1